MAQEYYGGTPISGTYTPEAENVNLDSIAGMTSTNVQDGIEELKTSVDSKASSSHTHTKSEITDMFSVVNDLTTGGSTNALSAEMGKQLNSNLTQLPKCKIIPYGTFYIGSGNTSATWSLTDYGLSASNVDAIVLGSILYANKYATTLSGSDLTITTDKSETSRQHFAVVIYYH